jgi:predicted DNA-binding transcriptional regulator YafY
MPAEPPPRHHSDALIRLARLFRIIDLVRSHRAGLPLGRSELAQACECDIRTIQRDITLLQGEAGIPLEYDPTLHAYTLPAKGWVYPTVQITGDEAMALALAREMLGTVGVPCRQQIAAALGKLTAALPHALQEVSREAAEAVRIGVPSRDYSHSPVQVLMTAAAAKETVEIDYFSRSRREHSRRRVDAYAVEAREGQYWELHAWCHARQAIRTFAVDQIQEVRTVGETFAVREAEWAAFALAGGVMSGLRGGPPVDVEVRFDPVVAPYALDRRWPEGLTIQAQPDSSARLSGTVTGCEGVVPELLRWRRHARVLGGSLLKARMTEEVRALSALYAEEAQEEEPGK